MSSGIDKQKNKITIEEAISRTSGAPDYEGLVADIFHISGEKYAVSRAKRNLGRPKNLEEWNQKIIDTRDGRLIIDTDPTFHVLSVPKVQFIDKSLGYAQIDWIDGDNLGHPQAEKSSYDYFGFESKVRGFYEYLRFMSRLNSKGRLVVDHKSTSLIAKRNLINRSSSAEDFYKFFLVDVSILTPQLDLHESATAELMWEIETGQTGRGVKGGKLNDVLRSFITPDERKLFEKGDRNIYALAMPPKIRDVIHGLNRFPDAATAALDIDRWQLGLRSGPIDIGHYENAHSILKNLYTLVGRYPEGLEQLSIDIQNARAGDVNDFNLATQVAKLVGQHFLERSREY